jgi:hypothetical protein
MRKTIAGAAALAVFAIAAPVGAATNTTYTGEIAGDAKAMVELEIEARGDTRFVTEFIVRRFPLVCENGTVARLQRARLAGRARVTGKGRFELEAANAAQRLGIRGRLRGGTAGGTLRYSGMTEFADQTLDCEADGLRWTASR